MTPLLLVAVSVAGGVGGGLRLLADTGIRRLVPGAFPWGTSLINVTGSLALGIVVGLAADAPGMQQVATIVGTGLLGGYTTFSTASVETIRLVQQRRWMLASANAVAGLVLCVTAAVLGILLGTAA